MMMEKHGEKAVSVMSDYPCDNCDMTCDGWDAQFCCTLCQYLGGRDCDDCDPWDI